MSITYIERTRYIVIPPAGAMTIGLECGSPYKDYAAWVFCGSTPNLSVQPLYGGFNDGAPVVVNSAGPKKVFQVGGDEMRPSTTIINRHPGDESPAPSLKPELTITNNGAAAINVGVYMVAIPGGV